MFPNLQEQQNSNKICLKVVIGGDCFRLPKLPQSFQELDEIVKSKFESKLPENFCFKYEDNDNDSINVESNSDYEAFLEYCSQEKLKTIKLRIDSKQYKQYFNWYDQQQQQMQPNLNQQGTQSQQSVQQSNGMISVLINPYNTYYQNISTKSSKQLLPSINYPLLNEQIFGGALQSAAANQMYSSEQSSGLLQMILTQLNLQNNLGFRGGQNTAPNIGINNNLGLNSGNNTNNNAVNNSLPQIPSLSKGPSEVNPGDQPNPLKKQSVNQSYSGMTEQNQNMSFANQQERRNTNVLQSGGAGCISNSFAPIIKQSVSKNAAGLQNMNSLLTMQVSQQYGFLGGEQMNITSNFGAEQFSSANPNSQKQNSTVPNPMDDDNENGKSALREPIKLANSISEIDEIQNPILSNQQSFMPASALNNISSITNNSQNQANSKSSQNLRGGNNELNSSTISTFIDTRSQTTGGFQGSTYSTNLFGGRLGDGLSSSSYTNQGKESSSNQQETSNLINFGGKKDYSPSPPISQATTLVNSTNTLMQSKITRPPQINANRSGQNMQVPCELCILWDDEQRNNPLISAEKFDATPNNNKEIISFNPNPKCNKCDGTGFLKLEDIHTFNVIQTVMRHKFKEAEPILRSLQVRQLKVEKIIPKESMDWLQKILQTKSTDNLINRPSAQKEQILSPFTPMQNKEKDFISNTSTNLITKNIHKISCCECSSDISQLKYLYLCIDCKSKNNKNIDGFGKKWQDDIVDFDNILCESCEDNHDTSHRVVQISKEDIMTVSANSNLQAPSSVANTPLQRPSILDRGRINNQIAFPSVNSNNNSTNATSTLNNSVLIHGFPRSSKPERGGTINLAQSTGYFSFPQQGLMTAPKNINYFSNQQQQSLQGVELNNHFSFLPPSIQLQQQQSIIQTQYPSSQIQQRQAYDNSQRGSEEVDGLAQQQLFKMRSKSDNKSHTTIINIPHQDEGFENFDQTQDDNQTQIEKNKARYSTNKRLQKINFNSDIKFKTNVTSSKKAENNNDLLFQKLIDDEEPLTFCDPTKFENKDQPKPGLNEIIISSPVVSQHPLVSDQAQNSNIANLIQFNPPSQSSVNSGFILEKVIEQKEESLTTIPKNESNAQIQIQQSSKITFTDITPEQKPLVTNSCGAINSICVKSSYATSIKLNVSQSIACNRPSLPIAKQTEDARIQYRAKLVNSYCSNDILYDNSVIVFQEILNNGNENWPENVYLKCISGITDQLQYPVIQVNKGEMMSIAFPIKISQHKVEEGEQVKTAWRLYHQQQNEERKYFGPKITIDFLYKQPKKLDNEETLEFLIQSAVTTMSNIFGKDSPDDIVDFVKQYRFFAEEYLEETSLEKREFCNLIIRFIENYIVYKNTKTTPEKVQQD